MIKGIQQRETQRDKRLDDMAREQVLLLLPPPPPPPHARAASLLTALALMQAKLDKKIAEDQVSTDIRLQRNVEGLGDAVKRIELLEEFLCATPRFCTLTNCNTLTLHANAHAAR